MNDDLERELERELHRILDPVGVMPIPARRPPKAHGLSRALFGGAGAAIGLKVLTAVAVAAAAVTVAGVTTTRSVNPVSWGHEVQQEVNDLAGPKRSAPTTATEAPNPGTSSHPHDQQGSQSGTATGAGQAPGSGDATGNGNGNANGGGDNLDNGKDPGKYKGKKPTDSPPSAP